MKVAYLRWAGFSYVRSIHSLEELPPSASHNMVKRQRRRQAIPLVSVDNKRKHSVGLTHGLINTVNNYRNKTYNSHCMLLR